MNKVILKIGGMSCSACSSGLEKYLNKQAGVHASVNLVMAQAQIEYEDTLKLEDIEQFVKEAGFESLGVFDEKEKEKTKSYDKLFLLIFALLAIFILYISMAHMIGLPTIFFLDMMDYPLNYAITLLVLTIFFLIYGVDLFKNGIKNLLHKSPNMDTLVTLGVMASFLYSLYGFIMVLLGNKMYVQNLYFESSAIIIFFIKLGRYIDSISKEKTKEAIKELVRITPDKALLKTKNGEKEITIDEVKEKDILIAKPGMKIAVDGEIISGLTHLDEAFITGEALASKKTVGSKVIAGSLNLDGYIEYKAQKIGKNSTISQIVRLVVEATNTKAPIARIADKVCGYFVPTIIIIAILTFLGYLLLGRTFNEGLSSFVSVLLVACPCALGLATPLAIVVSEGLCAKRGILVKNSATLENAHKINTIVFDKTGTLTYGNLKISKIYNYSIYNEEELLKKVATLEAKSTHPIAQAIINSVKKRKIKLLKLEEFQDLPGIGLTGTINQKKLYVGNNKLFSKLKLKNEHSQEEEELAKAGNSIIYIIEDNKVLGLIGVKDIVRENAKKTVQKLHKLGLDIIMLTGDNEDTAKIIANSIGIKTVMANMYPQEKTEVIKNLKEQEKNVMMVGDGINDAPSLATANVGVSVNSGTDIAANSSDVILMQDNLESIITLIDISKKTIRNIKQNLFWAFFYNICMIPIAIGLLKPIGLEITPMIAGIAMTISSLSVVFNALRLKRWKER